MPARSGSAKARPKCSGYRSLAPRWRSRGVPMHRYILNAHRPDLPAFHQNGKAVTRHELGIASQRRSEEHTSELQSLMRISYAVFCLKKKKKKYTTLTHIILYTHQKYIFTQTLTSQF